MSKILIIGGGVSGLSTGCYAQMNGFESEIYEMHTIPGGVCTTWKRGEFLFDHCIHWVLGSNNKTSLHPIFKELGISDNIQFHYPDIYRVIHLNDKILTAYTNIDKLEDELLRLFPDEKIGISKYSKILRKYVGFNPPMDGDFGKFGIKGYIKMLPFLSSFFRLKNISIESYLHKTFKNEELKEMLFRLFPVKMLPAIMAIMPLSFMHRMEGGYPLGGSLNFAREIEKTYLGLGGKIFYKRKVKEIIINNNRAVGIKLEDGNEIVADIIVSACDGKTVLYKMLHEKYITKKLNKLYENPSLWPPILSISLGIDKDLSYMPAINDFKLKEPFIAAGKQNYWCGFFHYCHDPYMAPMGKSVIKAQIETDYDYWKDLYDSNIAEYNKQKNDVLNAFILILEERLPGIKEKIEITDIASPVTWERYTGNWKGSYEGWLPVTKFFGTKLPKKLPGLNNFYMTGQWVFPGGGVPMCMAQSKNLIKIILNEKK